MGLFKKEKKWDWSKEPLRSITETALLINRLKRERNAMKAVVDALGDRTVVTMQTGVALTPNSGALVCLGFRTALDAEKFRLALAAIDKETGSGT